MLPTLTLLAIAGLFLFKPDITGFVIFKPLDTSAAKVVLYMSEGEVLPEQADVKVSVGTEERMLTAKQFIGLSDQTPQRVELLGGRGEYGIAGENTYSVPLEKLGFKSHYLWNEVELKAVVTYEGMVLQKQNITIVPG